MQEVDCRAIRSIEEECMENPWSLAQIQSEREQGSTLQLVAESDGQLTGFIFFRYCLPEAELLRIGVKRDRQRSGIGGALIGEGLPMLYQLGASSCHLEVRCSNKPAKSLYSRFGFIETGRRPNYYRGPKEDAVLMQRIDLSPAWRNH